LLCDEVGRTYSPVVDEFDSTYEASVAVEPPVEVSVYDNDFDVFKGEWLNSNNVVCVVEVEVEEISVVDRDVLGELEDIDEDILVVRLEEIIRIDVIEASNFEEVGLAV
jgi:hypothetical protein